MWRWRGLGNDKAFEWSKRQTAMLDNLIPDCPGWCNWLPDRGDMVWSLEQSVPSAQ
jgi:hypothetical protein